ncbi:MAG TPA: NifU family protein [Aromatoleum sp.]|uniref:NifU family protein n=1 Tax=Aromatoleum sp. TaxID=2307007 RepID=UPI002B46430E|nr:NifU family protein [Aromatoleum sp.]HJV25983.1 NifU family protein [Aromatoleum sp.]
MNDDIALDIAIDPAASDHLKQMLAKQGADCAGVRLYVLHPGTSLAHAGLGYARRGEHPQETRLAIDGLPLWFDPAHASYLREARITCHKSMGGRQLKLVAPHIKHSVAPPPDAPLELQLSHFLETEINPHLADHQGSVVLHGIERGDTALLKFGGSCHGCGQADQTLSEFVAVKIRERFPAISQVSALATMHPPHG